MLLGGLTLAISSCGTDEPKTENLQANYFVLKPGAEYIYRVDSVNFLKIPYDTSKYWQREVVGQEVEALDGALYHEIKVYKKFTWNENWRLLRTDLARNTETYSERYTENVMFRKMVYPITSTRVWTAAPYNDIELLYDEGVTFNDATYSNIHQVCFIDQHGFDSTVSVIQFERYDFIHRFNYREKYANNVGLIKRVEINVEYQDPDPLQQSDTSEYEAVNGYKLIQKIVDYNIPR